MVDQAVPTSTPAAPPPADPVESLHADAAAWKDGGRRNGHLYDAARLAALEQVCPDESRLSGDARDFLAQSRGRLIDRRRNRRAVLAVAGVATVAAVAAGVTAAVDTDPVPYADVNATLTRVAELRGTDTTASAQLAAAVAAAHPDDGQAVAALRDTQSDILRRDLDPTRAHAVSGASSTGRVAVAGDDGSVRIVDGGRVVSTVSAAPGDRTVTAALDPNGTRLVTSGADGSVRVWSVGADGIASATGSLAATGVATTAVALAGDRPWAVVADARGTMRVVSLSDPARPRTLASLPGSGAAITTLSVDPSRAVVAAGGPTRPLTVDDISTPDAPERITAEGGTSALRAVAFSPDGSTAVTTDEAGSSQLWSVGDTAVTPIGEPLTAPAPGGATATFSPDGTLLAITATAGVVSVVDVSRPTAPRALATPARVDGRQLLDSAFVDGNRVVTATSGAPIVWTMPPGLLTGGFGTPTDASCAVTRPYCAAGFLRGPVRVFQRDSATGVRQIGEIDAPDHFDGASMSPDGRWMMTVDARHRAQLWDVTTIGRPVAVGPAVMLGPQQRNHLVFSPDSSRLLTGFGSGDVVRVWRVTADGLAPAGDVSAASAGAGGTVTAVGVAPDSRGIVLGTDQGQVVTARLTESAATVAGPVRTVGGPVTTVAALDDGIVVGDALGGLHHFTGDARTPDATVDTGTAPVGTALADGEGAVLASVGDGSIRRWEFDGDLTLIGTPGTPGSVGELHMTRTQGTGLLLTGTSGLTRAWDVDATAARTRLCTAAPQTVDPATPLVCGP